MAKIKADRKTLIRWKIYIDRAKMYIGYIQFLMIAFVLLEAYKDSSMGKLIFDNMLISIPIIFLIFIILSLLVGRIDTILGLREEELRNASSSNPVMREILKNIEEVKGEVQKLKSSIEKKDEI
ncbi:hypothetical protein [Lentimicrobium sp. S6]|uniref:hypothetical protein n=1 Tax=Lentimicrobium sp. S6 TaxID=2735872 RepID=UPI0015561C4E|nr:hypothetical protein [Lentimicrobium sp. S6]MBF8984758.1 hypothetical protein [Lutibacter sp. B2]NPD47403.1 hypothetical protein [Lentimicrobium sp. S6]